MLNFMNTPKRSQLVDQLIPIMYNCSIKTSKGTS